MTIFEYHDYKTYFRHYIKELPRRGRGEIKKFADHLNVNATMISQIISGPKDFTIEQGEELADYFGLSELEKDYLILLIQKERAGTHKLKKYYDKKISDIRRASLKLSERVVQDHKLTDYERSVFYSSWLYSATRLTCSLDIPQSAETISQRFQISRARAMEMLRFLVDAGLCKEENGRITMGPSRTHLEFGSPFLVRHHSNWRIKAIEKSESLTAEELMYTAPLSISRKDFALLRERFASMISDLVNIVKDSEAEDIACCNIDFFWVK